MLRRFLTILLLGLAESKGFGAEPLRIISWERALLQLRDKGGPLAIYCGSPANNLPRKMVNGEIDTNGIPFVVIPSTLMILNPFTGKEVAGGRMHDHFGATAGTIVFLDRDGMAIPAVSMPWGVHRDDPATISLISGFVAGGHHRLMDLTEYARSIGKEEIIEKALKQNPVGLTGREIGEKDLLPTMRNVTTGEIIDPWSEIGVFYVFALRYGPVCEAQLHEVWNAFGNLQPKITLILPPGEEPTDQRQLPAGMQAVLAQAPREAIAMLGTGPSTVCTTNADGRKRGLVFEGFVPALVYSRLLGIPVQHREKLNRDIPHGEKEELIAKVSQKGSR